MGWECYGKCEAVGSAGEGVRAIKTSWCGAGVGGGGGGDDQGGRGSEAADKSLSPKLFNNIFNRIW